VSVQRATRCSPRGSWPDRPPTGGSFDPRREVIGALDDPDGAHRVRFKGERGSRLNARERPTAQREIHRFAPAFGFCLVEARLEGLVRGNVISNFGPLLRLFLSVLEKARDSRVVVRGLGTLGSTPCRRGRGRASRSFEKPRQPARGVHIVRAARLAGPDERPEQCPTKRPTQGTPTFRDVQSLGKGRTVRPAGRPAEIGLRARGTHRAKTGLLEAADGGTLFLDEVAEIPRAVQLKLLWILESGKVRRLGLVKPWRVDVDSSPRAAWIWREPGPTGSSVRTST
jgi:hypothetical protein